MKNEDFYREACRRKHRVLGHYLAIQAWLRKLDCIVLQRRELEHFLGLERFKSTRVTWLINDLKPWFPFHVSYYLSNSPSSIHTLFLSLIDMVTHLPKGTMTTDQRISRLAPDAPKTEKFLLKTSAKPPSEEHIVSELALVTAGLREPAIFSLES
jgi:hypothetical protein